MQCVNLQIIAENYGVLVFVYLSFFDFWWKISHFENISFVPFYILMMIHVLFSYIRLLIVYRERKHMFKIMYIDSRSRMWTYNFIRLSNEKESVLIYNCISCLFTFGHLGWGPQKGRCKTIAHETRASKCIIKWSFKKTEMAAFKQRKKNQIVSKTLVNANKWYRRLSFGRARLSFCS